MIFTIQNPRLISKIIENNRKFQRIFAKTKTTMAKPIEFGLRLFYRNGHKMRVQSLDYDNQANALHLIVHPRKWPVPRDAELRIPFGFTIAFGKNVDEPSTRTLHNYSLDAVFQYGSKLLLSVDHSCVSIFMFAWYRLFSVENNPIQLATAVLSENLIDLEELTGIPCSADHVKQYKWPKAVNLYKNHTDYQGLLVIRNDTESFARQSSAVALRPQPSNCMCFLQCFLS